ncbi:MAG: hypothetical protein IPL78_21575 [Chloroflexi bacterium]|nr:hypothetical protein [Chloroflexota bacterium]
MIGQKGQRPQPGFWLPPAQITLEQIGYRLAEGGVFQRIAPALGSRPIAVLGIVLRHQKNVGLFVAGA